MKTKLAASTGKFFKIISSFQAILKTFEELGFSNKSPLLQVLFCSTACGADLDAELQFQLRTESQIPVLQAVLPCSTLSKLNFDCHEPKRKKDLAWCRASRTLHLQWKCRRALLGQAFVGMLQLHCGCSWWTQRSLGNSLIWSRWHTLACNPLALLDGKKSQTGCNCCYNLRGTAGGYNQPTQSVLFAECTHGSTRKAIFLQEAIGRKAGAIFIVLDPYLPFAPRLHLLQSQQGNWASPSHVSTWLQNLFAAYQRGCGSGLCFNHIKNCFISTFSVLRFEGQCANANTCSEHQ